MSASDPIISGIFKPNATLNSTRYNLDIDNYESLIEAISRTWRMLKSQSNLEPSPPESFINCIRDRIIPVLEGYEEEEHSKRDVLLDITAMHLARGKFDDETVLALRLGIYIWCMCKIDIPFWNQHFPLESHIAWTNPESRIRDQITLLSRPTESNPRNIRLDSSFRLYDLAKIANFGVEWVDDIFQHLSFCEPNIMSDKPQMKIQIFHHRRFLKFHYDRQSKVFPEGFIEETLQTLDLLLPYHHTKTRKWFQNEVKHYGIDDTACVRKRMMNANSRHLERFKFWGERLAFLKETYDLTEPDSVSRFWLDTRSPIQWATFWVAVLVLVLTIFFGLVQSIEGALQVYKAYHPSS
ncbi:hypothetical protein PENSTE_c011G06797 [Penicillium steckii]|uniref:Uncharacterized protein n=1 Tax=Penicillium steckii TaxID=303698 RepID=A0A1V6T6D8_9EURO|nr:hypothetical protein PENSTE_c011G06797 [Penicillium steckii]